jgi:hypothetical protein
MKVSLSCCLGASYDVLKYYMTPLTFYSNFDHQYILNKLVD